jgi:hypothetical protein
MKKVEHVGALVQKPTLVRSKELKGLSVSRSHLWNLAKAGKIERVGRGLYRAKEAPISTNETLFESRKGSHSDSVPLLRPSIPRTDYRISEPAKPMPTCNLA